jgi:hypothetical protein
MRTAVVQYRGIKMHFQEKARLRLSDELSLTPKIDRNSTPISIQPCAMSKTYIIPGAGTGHQRQGFTIGVLRQAGIKFAHTRRNADQCRRIRFAKFVVSIQLWALK